MTATKAYSADTNIPIYSVDASDDAKQCVAGRIIRAMYVRHQPLPLQVLSEFYRAPVRKQLLTATQAAASINEILSLITIELSNREDLLRAVELHQVTQHQFFDCLLLATAARAGCTTLFSEDFQHNRTYGSITVLNPFQLTTPELDALLS